MKPVHNISYGLYVLSANTEKQNACIINTLMQVTSTNPTIISVTVNKENYTCFQIKKTGVFNVSILDMTANFDLIKRFGFASGKDTNKFEGFSDFKLSKNGVVYITKHTNAYISAKVVSQVDIGTHITFFAEITDESILSENKPITYAYYLENVKPKPEQKPASKVVHVCRICGYVYEGDPLPKDFICPLCKHGAEDFDRVEQGEQKTEQKVESKPEQKAEGKKTYVCPVCGYEEVSDTKPEKCIICGAEMVEKK